MGINYFAVVVAAITSFVLGFIWYGAFFKRAWMKAMSLSEGDLKMERPWVPYIVSFITSVALAVGLTVILRALEVTSLNGAVGVALLMWLGFVAFVMARNYAYANKTLKLYAIDAGYVLVEMIVIALIITAWL